MSPIVILLVILILWLVIGSLAGIAEAVFWIVAILIIVSAGGALIRYINSRSTR